MSRAFVRGYVRLLGCFNFFFSLCRVKFYLKRGETTSQGKKKNAFIAYSFREII